MSEEDIGKIIDCLRIKLRKEIQTVLREDKLKSILNERQNTFGKNIYSEITGDSYEVRLINCIQELTNKNLFPTFVENIINDYPTVKPHYINYKTIEEILNLINKNNNDDELIPNTHDFNSNLQLKDYVESKVLTLKDINPSIQERLNEWIRENFRDIDIPYKQTKQPTSTLQSYLLIIIYPLRGKIKTNRNKTFNVQAEFIENFPQTPNRKVDLNQEYIKEDGYLEKDIPNIIYKLIDKIIEETHQMKYNINELKIDLFLPFDCLTKEFEVKIPAMWKTDKTRICDKFCFVLRPFERHYYNKMIETGNFTAVPDKVGKKSSYDTFTTKLTQLAKVREDKSINVIEKSHLEKKYLDEQIKEAIIIQISCGLPTKLTKRIELFKIIYEHGIPVCLWVKKEVGASLLGDGNVRFLNVLKNGDIDELYKEVSEMRKKHLDGGNYLGVLCDHNSDRVPVNWPNFNQLTT